MNDKPKQQRNFMMKPEDQPPFAGFMGMKITHTSAERVTAEMLVTNELANRNGVLHGGALMALADNLGGTAACCNLPETGGSPRRSRARPISSHRSRSAMLPRRNAHRCIAGERPRCGRPRSLAATASSPRS